jgi:hypothetical protein
MKQLKINIDIDNTVNDFIEKFVHFCNEMRPIENQFYVDAMVEYSLEKDTKQQADNNGPPGSRSWK